MQSLVLICNKNVGEYSPRVELKDVALYNDTNYMINDSVESVTTISGLILSHFGLREVDKIRLDAILIKIQRSYPYLTFNQLKEIFIDSDVEKKPYLDITPTEFCSYIEKWEVKRKKIRSTLEILAKEEEEKEAKKNAFLEFKSKCDKAYKDSIKAGKWIGDHFEAIYLLKNGKNTLPKDIQNQIYTSTRALHIQYIERAKVLALNDFFDENLLLTRDHLYAQIAMEKIFSEEWYLK